MEVVLSWKLLFSTRAWHSIFYSGAIKCFVYPSANRTLLLQERTGHLGAQPVETHHKPNCFSSSLFFCFDRHFKFSRGLPLYTCSQTPVPGSPFPVPDISNILLTTVITTTALGCITTCWTSAPGAEQSGSHIHPSQGEEGHYGRKKLFMDGQLDAEKWREDKEI